MKSIPVILWLLLWAVAVYFLAKSDGICRGVCEGCVYQGNCPQERR